jgi:hypothetical protein
VRLIKFFIKRQYVQQKYKQLRKGPTVEEKEENDTYGQYCGSGMFIPDPDFFHPGSRVKKIPGSQFRIRIKEFEYFNPNNCF